LYASQVLHLWQNPYLRHYEPKAPAVLIIRQEADKPFHSAAIVCCHHASQVKIYPGHIF